MNLLENVRIFRRVAELQSFSSAAREFEVGPPTVSKAIQALEAHFGVTLLRRTTRGVSLTSEGQKLLQLGRSWVDQADLMLASVRNEKLLLKGQIRISASLAFSRLIIAPLLGAFSRLHPELKLSFHLSDGFVDLVESGIDVAIRIGEQPDSTLKVRKVGISRRCLYASKDYLREFGHPKNIEALPKHRLLYYTRISDRPSWPLHTPSGEARPFAFEPYFQSDGSDLVREMVIRGMGIALIPTWMMAEEEEKGRVVRLFPRHSRSPAPVYLVTSNTMETTAKQKAFIDFVSVNFGQHPALNLRTED